MVYKMIMKTQPDSNNYSGGGETVSPIDNSQVTEEIVMGCKITYSTNKEHTLKQWTKFIRKTVGPRVIEKMQAEQKAI